MQAGDGVRYDVFGPGIPSFHAQASSLADGYGLRAHTSARYTVINVILTSGQSMLANGIGRITTPPFNVQVGVPFEVELELDTNASATGPVFTLPVGYTANSPEAGIIDNSFVVPEPSAEGMLACGFGALLLADRTRRRPASSH